jgi:hypothetical protein
MIAIRGILRVFMIREKRDHRLLQHVENLLREIRRFPEQVREMYYHRMIENGIIDELLVKENTTTNTGLTWIADRLTATPDWAAATHLGVGKGTVVDPTEATALDDEVDRIALDGGFPSNTANTLFAQASFGASMGWEPETLTEHAIFNHSSAGQCLFYDTMTFEKREDDTFISQWEITFTRKV